MSCLFVLHVHIISFIRLKKMKTNGHFVSGVIKHGCRDWDSLLFTTTVALSFQIIIFTKNLVTRSYHPINDLLFLVKRNTLYSQTFHCIHFME